MNYYLMDHEYTFFLHYQTGNLFLGHSHLVCQSYYTFAQAKLNYYLLGMNGRQTSQNDMI